MPGIDITLPPLEAHPAHRPETSPAKVKAWLAQQAAEPADDAALTVGDALSVLNRTRLADTVRLELMELYTEITDRILPQIRRDLALQAHPLGQEALKGARNAIHLACQVAHGYKRVLAENAEKRIAAGSMRLRLGLIHRAQQALGRILLASYSSHCPVPSNTWRDLHQVYAYARRAELHREAISPAHPEVTPESSYIQALLLALVNPYGLMPDSLSHALRFLGEHGKLARLSEEAPTDLHDSVRAVIDLSADRPPVLGARMLPIKTSILYLDNARIAIELNRQLRELEGLAADPARAQYIEFLRGLRQHWRSKVPRDLPRFARDSRVIVTSGFSRVWDCAQGSVPAAEEEDADVDSTTVCAVLDHAPGNGYTLRQLRAIPTPARIGELIAIRALVGGEWHVGVVRWFRNTMSQQLLEFGCEVLGRAPEAAAVIVERVERRRPHPALLLAAEPELEWNESLITAAQLLDVERNTTLQRRGVKFPVRVGALRESNSLFSQYDFSPL